MKIRSLVLGSLLIITGPGLPARAQEELSSAPSHRNLDFVGECKDNPTASCVYETLIVGATVAAQRGIHMGTPAFEYQRRERADQIIRDLLDLGEYEIAKHFALRELAQRDLVDSHNKSKQQIYRRDNRKKASDYSGAVGNISSVLALYKQALGKNSSSDKMTDEPSLFERQYTDQRYMHYLEDSVYSQINDDNLGEVAQFLDGLELKHINGNYVFRLDGLGVVHPREYIDALNALSIAYLAEGDLSRAEEYLNKMNDQPYLDKLLNWENKPSELTADKGRTFEFLDVMIGPGAGTDPRVAYISTLITTSQAQSDQGQLEQAMQSLAKAQEVASFLENPSLSRSKAFVMLSGAQAQAKNYDKAFENAQSVRLLCCVPLRQGNPPLMQDPNHYDAALSGIVTGALYNQDSS